MQDIIRRTAVLNAIQYGFTPCRLLPDFHIAGSRGFENWIPDQKENEVEERSCV